MRQNTTGKITRIVLLLLTVIAPQLAAQNVVQVTCDKFGAPDWATYEAYRKEHPIKTGSIPRKSTDDKKLIPITPESKSIYHYVLDKLYFRWQPLNDSIPLKIRGVNILREEILNTHLSECAIKVNIDALVNASDGSIFTFTLHHLPEKQFSTLLTYTLAPMEAENRAHIVSMINRCSDLPCKIDLLMERRLYIDALSLLEQQVTTSKADEKTKSLFWATANKIRIGR